MQHNNPFLQAQASDHRFITMGEIMLRLNRRIMTKSG